MIPFDTMYYSKGDIIMGLQILASLFLFALGFAAGWWFYHYTLKHDPEKLAKINADAKKLGEKLK